MTRDEELKRLSEEEADLRPKLDRAERAGRILTDPLVIDALEAVRDKAAKAFRSVDLGDTAGLVNARCYYEAAEEFMNDLVKHVKTGQIAAEHMQRINTRRDYLRDEGLRRLRA